MSLNASIQIRATGASLVASQFGAIEQRVAALRATGQRTASTLRGTLGRDISFLTGNLGKLYAVAGGLGLAVAAKRAMTYVEALSEIQVRARLSADGINKLKESIDATADATKQAPAALAQGMLAFTEAGGSLDKARASIQAIADTAKAAGEPSLENMARLARVLTDELGIAPEKLKDAMGLLQEQGRAPGAELAFKGQNIAALTELLERGEVRGMKGAGAVRQLGGLFQFAGAAGAGGPGSAAEFMGSMRRLSKTNEVSVFNKKTGEMRAIPDIMLDVMRKARGDRNVVTRVFRGNEVALAFANAYDKKTKGWKAGSDVDKFWNVQGGAADIDAASKLRREGIGKPLYEKNRLKKWFDKVSQQYGADALGFVGENPGTSLALGLGGAAGIKLLAPWLAKKMGKGGAGAAAALGGAASGAGLPVRVMNWPASMGGPSGNLPSGAREFALGGAPGAAKAAAAGAVSAGLGAALLGMFVGESDARQKAEIGNKALNDAARVVAKTTGGDAGAIAAQAKDAARLSVFGPGAKLVAAIEHLDRTIQSEPRQVQVSFLGSGLDKPEVKASRGGVR